MKYDEDCSLFFLFIFFILGRVTIDLNTVNLDGSLQWWPLNSGDKSTNTSPAKQTVQDQIRTNSGPSGPNQTVLGPNQPVLKTQRSPSTHSQGKLIFCKVFRSYIVFVSLKFLAVVDNLILSNACC